MTIGSASSRRIVKRGDSDDSGSWKIICTRRRSHSRSARVSPVRSRPSTRTRPEVGRFSPTSALASVVLPLPLSPTRPSVSPTLSVRLMPATACTPPAKVTLRSSTSMVSGAAHDGTSQQAA